MSLFSLFKAEYRVTWIEKLSGNQRLKVFLPSASLNWHLRCFNFSQSVQNSWEEHDA